DGERGDGFGRSVPSLGALPLAEPWPKVLWPQLDGAVESVGGASEIVMPEQPATQGVMFPGSMWRRSGVVARRRGARLFQRDALPVQRGVGAQERLGLVQHLQRFMLAPRAVRRQAHPAIGQQHRHVEQVVTKLLFEGGITGVRFRAQQSLPYGPGGDALRFDFAQ